MNKLTLKERLVIIVASAFIITIGWLLVSLAFPSILNVRTIVMLLVGMIMYHIIDSIVVYFRFRKQ